MDARALPGAASTVVFRWALVAARIVVPAKAGNVVATELDLRRKASGAVFVEAIFAWPGVGQVLVQAVQARDYPVVMAAATISAVLVVAGNLLAEFLMTLADPRTRHAEG